MARFAAGIFFVFAVAWLAWYGSATIAPADTLAPAETLPAGNSTRTPAAPGLIGVGSCASASCHGGAIHSPFAWQRSYSVWSTEDKHSRAYQVLFGEQAKRIVQLLDELPSLDQARPFDDHRCLGCHTTADPAAPRAREMLADGIGCESCHGPSQAWLVDHTRWPSSLAESDRRAKMVNAMRRNYSRRTI